MKPQRPQGDFTEEAESRNYSLCGLYVLALFSYAFKNGCRKAWLWFSPILLLTTTVSIQCTQKKAEQAFSVNNNEYVGRNACQSCHQSVYSSFLKTGMGRSMYMPDKKESIERFGSEDVVYDPQKDFYYQAYWSGEEMFVQEFRLNGKDTSYKRIEKVNYIIGSGHQTRSYLMEKQGFWYEFPITWYVGKQIWDLSPGYKGNNSRFDREIGEQCLACHTGNFTHVKGSTNRFEQVNLGIDCEQCHGPGRKHIELMETLKEGSQIEDYAIIEPSALPPVRQFDVCQQCHLQGVQVLTGATAVRDFRPGMHLSDAFEVFIEQDSNENAFGIASHAERLQQSRCFIASEGKLNCTTCHNPHKSIDYTDSKRYIRQCQNCHDQTQEALVCSASESKKLVMDGNCISCHMPEGGTRDIPHVSFHDHKIRVLRTGDSTANIQSQKEFLELLCASNEHPSNEIWGKAWLQYFERHKREEKFLQRADGLLPADNYAERARLAFFQKKYPAADQLVERALKNSPKDAELYFLKGEVLEALRKYDEAASAFIQSYQLNKKGIDAGLKYGVNLLKAYAGNTDTLNKAGSIFESLIEEKPFDKRLQSNLGFVRIQQGRLAEATALIKQALANDPDYGQALFNMCGILLMQGNKAEARIVLQHLLDKHPDYPGVELMIRESGLNSD